MRTSLKQVVLVTAAALSVAGTAFADDGWTELGAGVAYQNGSFEYGSTKGGTKIASVIVRFRNRGNITIQRLGMDASTCIAGHGSIRAWSMNGQAQEPYDYARGAGSNASTIGDGLCGIWAEDARNARDARDDARPTRGRVAL